jgi:hypothetical protein
MNNAAMAIPRPRMILVTVFMGVAFRGIENATKR